MAAGAGHSGQGEETGATEHGAPSQPVYDDGASDGPAPATQTVARTDHPARVAQADTAQISETGVVSQPDSEAYLPPQAAPPEPPGYYDGPPRGPVPATLGGAEVINAGKAAALHAEGAAFFDVYPRITRPEGLPEGTIWREPVHLTIPDAIWLYDTGYAALSEAEQSRFAQALARAGGPDKDRPIVIFCLRDCWLSWNAARRAVSLGHSGIHWFPGGADEWAEAGGALVPAIAP